VSAPLYNRYRRYADREAKRFGKHSRLRHLIPMWKRPNTRVYSLSEWASYEAGAWSASEPGELMRAISLQYLPTDQVWIEFDWKAFNKGSNGKAWDDPAELMYLGKNGLKLGDSSSSSSSSSSPVRMGFMIYDPMQVHSVVFEGTEQSLGALLFYLFDNGTSFVAPVLSAWQTCGDPEPRQNATDDFTVMKHALGKSYLDRYEKKNPRLTKQLGLRVFQSLIGVKDMNLDRHTAEETQGTCRIALSCLTAALAARAADIDPNKERNPREPRKDRRRGPENRNPIEVDLFIRNRPKRAGGSIKSSVGHMEGVKKGLHTVGAHWAYRARKDGGDPTECTHAEKHDFEAVPDTNTEVCVFCWQKRWFKRTHQRGDEQYGIVPQKTFNVRAGAPQPPKETTRASP